MKDLKSSPEWVARHIASLPKSGIRDFFELVNSMQDVISLGIGEPDFDTPWHIREATIYALNRGFTSYTSNLATRACARQSAITQKSVSTRISPGFECIITVGVSEGWTWRACSLESRDECSITSHATSLMRKHSQDAVSACADIRKK